MSNNITKFLNSRNEVNLSSEKIELSIAADLNKAVTSSENLTSNAFGQIQKAAENLSKLADKFGSDASSEKKLLESLMDKYAQASKDLGLDYSNAKSYTMAGQALRDVEDLIKSSSKVSSAVKGGAIGNI